MAEFHPGRIYNRRQELHAPYGGQQQGGISTPSKHPLIFLFTGQEGEMYGYKDEFRSDWSYWYTGEGQIGPMPMIRGNRAIRDHEESGKDLHLFEQVDKGVRYVGQFRCLGHHTEPRPDMTGALREAIVFELEAVARESTPKVSQLEIESPIARLPNAWTRPLKELRDLALSSPQRDAEQSERRVVARQRSEAVKHYVLRRGNGVSECCTRPAPFKRKDGRPYLEPHHITRMADGGPDHPRWAAGVCPNCHREAHYGADREAVNQRISERLEVLEKD